jgi:hypothetical protein
VAPPGLLAELATELATEHIGQETRRIIYTQPNLSLIVGHRNRRRVSPLKWARGFSQKWHLCGETIRPSL